MNIGYIIPEFPGQTHIWMWREIVQLRRWGVPIKLFSTRRPPDRDRARHAFAEGAAAETAYLWPMSAGRAASTLAWALARHPVGFLRCLALALTLPTTTRFRQLGVLPLLLPAAELARRCEASGIDRLHSHTCSNSAILCMMVKRLSGLPWSMTLNNRIELWGGAMKEKFEDATFTVAITRQLLEQMRRDYPSLAPGQALLGRIGVDTDLWTPGPRAPSPDGALRLAIVARLHLSKGHMELFEALDLLRKRGRAVALHIIGEGPDRAAYEARVRELGLEQAVTFAGSLSQERIIEELRGADAFVLPSHLEALGVAYMEAMSLGVPTIGTNAGGVPEIIDDGVHGILVPPHDPPALAAAIERLADDPALRERLGKAGREKIVAEFDARVGAATLHEQFLGRPPPEALPAARAKARAG